MKSYLKNNFTLFIVMLFLITLIGACYLWLKREHQNTEAIAIAQQFVTLLHQDKLEPAYALSVKNNSTGKTLEAFKEKVKRERCVSEPHYDYTFPFQSNGNRLRRWVNGSNLDPEQIIIEFKSECLLGIRLKKNLQQQWEVTYFARHAG